MNVWEALDRVVETWKKPTGASPEDSYEHDERTTKKLCQDIVQGHYKAYIDENGVMWLNNGSKDLGYGGQWIRADKA